MQTEENTGSLYLGTFDSEKFWRNPELSTLPSFEDRQADAMVRAMDELQFVFCSHPKDKVITRYSMDPAHRNYLRELGFAFSSNEFAVYAGISEEPLVAVDSICQLLTQTKHEHYFGKMISGLQLSPYSVLPATSALCKKYSIKGPIPGLEAVKKVNSKAYSHRISKQLLENQVGQIAHSAKEVGVLGKEFLRKSLFLIKDNCGVSGKGNLLIASDNILERIVRHLNEQEKRGKRTELLLEPLLDKCVDFSCHFKIGLKGEVTIVSVQQMQNRGASFSRIWTAGLQLRQKLERSEYFEHVETIARALHREGYFGYVCVDSMILRNGQIVPVVEINARKSMGLINHFIDRFLSQYSVCGKLVCFTLQMSLHIKFEELLDRMRKRKVLFQKRVPSGLFPLSANTLQVNRKSAGMKKSLRFYKGRLYAAIATDTPEGVGRVLNTMNKIFADFGARPL